MRSRKKGETSPLAYMAGIIIMGILIISILVYVRRSTVTVDGVTSKYLDATVADLDYDGIKDFYDKSPCVAGQDTFIATDDGKMHFYFADPIDGKCEPASFGITDASYEIEMKRDSFGKDVCALKNEACARILVAQYEEMEQYRKEKEDS